MEAEKDRESWGKIERGGERSRVSEQRQRKIESVRVGRGKIKSIGAEAEKDRERRSESERLLMGVT